MNFGRYFVTVDWDETTKIHAYNYALAEHEANKLLAEHFKTTGEKSKAYIFQDLVEIATIHFEG
jgi:hypothetical protein